MEDVYEAKKKQWRMKGPGIVAKFIVSDPRRARAFGIKIVESSSTTTSALLPFEAQLQIWRPILLAKFEQNRDAYDVLMSTVPYHLVEEEQLLERASLPEDGGGGGDHGRKYVWAPPRARPRRAVHRVVPPR